MKQQTLNSKAANEPKEIIFPRKEIVVILATIKGVPSVHFCNDELLSGVNYNVWFPVDTKSETALFRSVENIMMVNFVCHNVVSMTCILQNTQDSADYKVVYNSASHV
ncbi:hypothetical protein ABNR98_004449 [Salmonella enterica]